MSAVSVIIPARDAAGTLAETLDSVLAQSFGDWEAIVVDDGSRDATAAIAADYAVRDSRIRMTRAPGLGVSGARNAGIAEARGSRLLFLDADDWLARDQLGRLHAAIEAAPHAVASYCGHVRVTPAGHAFLPRFGEEVAHDAAQLFARRNGLAVHAALVARAHVEAIGGFDPGLVTCEDWDLWQRLAFQRGPFVPVRDIYAPYRLRPASLSQRLDQLHADGSAVIDRGFTALRVAGGDAGAADLGLALSTAHFDLWCTAIAAARGTPLNIDRAPFRSSGYAREAAILANMLVEAFCVGACCAPAALPVRIAWFEEALEAVLGQFADAPLRDAVRSALHRSLGTDAPAATLVSVVVPAYNGAATIDETLASVRAQSHARLEVIVVDDGSRDRTADCVLSHAAVDPRISLLRQANAGVAAARNSGWQSAAADVVAFVDADDLWAPGKIARQLAAIEAAGPCAGLAYTWYARIDQESRVIGTGHRPQAKGRVLDDIFRGNFIGNGSAALIRRSVLEEVGGFDPGLRARGAQGCEDFSIYFRIAEHHEFALVPQALTGYRTLPGNMSSDMLQMLRSWKIVAGEMAARHPESRQAIDEGLTDFIEWSILSAAERGDFIAALRLLPDLVGRAPAQALRLVIGPLPRRCARGLRILLGMAPRRRSRQPAHHFAIGNPDREMAPVV